MFHDILGGRYVFCTQPSPLHLAHSSSFWLGKQLPAPTPLQNLLVPLLLTTSVAGCSPSLFQQGFSDGIVSLALPATLALVDALLSEFWFQKNVFLCFFFFKLVCFLWIYFSLSLSHSFGFDVCFKV